MYPALIENGHLQQYKFGLAKGGMRAGSRVFGDLAKSKTDLRTRRNDIKTDLAMDKNFNPNRRLGDALRRNTKGNFRENVGKFLGGGNIGEMSGVDFNNGLAQAYLSSISQGINPQLMAESRNIAGIPGLTIEGQEVAADNMPDLKGAGAAEIGFGGLSSFFGKG